MMRDRRLRAEGLIHVERQRTPHAVIGGLDSPSEGHVTIEVLDASDGRSLGRCPLAHPRDIEKAVEAAAQAAVRLEMLSPSARASALERLAAALDELAEDWVILECLQTGRSYRDVLASDITPAAELLRSAASWAREPEGSLHELGHGRRAWVDTASHRVRAAVLPLSEPLAAAVRHTALSLAAGSGLVLLAPAEAPLTVLRWGALVRDLDELPTGSVNVVSGDERDAAEELAKSPLVDTLSYAGPREVARRMLVGAAKSNLKTVAFELDDKTPCIILEDADTGQAVDVVWRSGLSSPSQLGRAIGRVLVHASRYSDVANRLASLAKATLLGHPLEEHTELGPLASPARLRRALGYVELGRREGASVVAGGQRDVEGTRYLGNYVLPTVFLNPPWDGRLIREPIDGPVLTVEPFEDDAEAVHRASYGLGRGGAVVFSRDVQRAQRLGRQLRVGQVFINGPIQFFSSLPHARGSETGPPILGRSGLQAGGFPRSMIVYEDVS